MLFKNLIVILLLAVVVQVCWGARIFNPYNNHYYEKFTSQQLSNSQAISACSQQTGPGSTGQGYLATFTSKLEWSWAESAGLLGTESWISGDNPSQDFKTWFVSSGPEDGQLIDSPSTGCLTYCPWGLTEPSFSTNEFYLCLFYRPANVNYTQINNVAANVASSYICEYGGFGKPVIDAPVSTNGGLVTVRGYSGSINDSTSVTFTQIGDSITDPTIMTCPLQQNSTQYSNFTCLLPAGTGVYNVEITINGTTSNTTFQYMPPLISYMFRDAENITIVGQNFGNSGSNIKIYMGIHKTNRCINPVVSNVKSNQVIYCTLDPVNVVVSLFPISVDVSGVEAVFNDPPIYYYDTHSFYTITQACIPSFSQANALAIGRKVGPYSGYLGVIDSSSLYSFLNQSFAQNTGTIEGLSYTGGQFVYYASHPNASKPVTPYYTNTPNPNSNSNYRLNMNSVALLVGTSGCDSVLTQYYGQLPTIQLSSSNNIPNQGGQISLSAANMGHIFSVVQFVANISGTVQNLVSQLATDNSAATLTIPNGYGGPFEIWVTVDGLVSNKLSYSYIPPTFVSLESIPSTEGGVATVIGDNLYNQEALLKLVYINGETQLELPFSNFNGTTATVTIPSGTGQFSAHIILDTIPSNTLQLHYAEPHLEALNSTATSIDSGYITISGTSFGANSSLISVIGIDLLSPITILSPHNSIQFIVAPVKSETPISIKVDGQSSNTLVIPFYKITTTIIGVSSSYFNTSGNVTITGSGFTEYEANVTIAGQSCDNLYYINSTMLICNFKGVVESNGTALPVSVYSNNTLLAWEYLYFYRNNISCLNGCSNNGTCDTDFGSCICNPGYGGSDCSYLLKTNSHAPIVNSDGTATLPSDTIIFNIGIKYIREVSDITTIRTIDMASIIWQKTKSNLTYEKYDNTYVFHGIFPNDTLTINVNITVFLEAGQVIFAGEPINMLDNSVKFQISIQGWEFSDRLHTLQLIYDTVGDRVESGGCPLRAPLPSGNVTLYDVPVPSQGVVLHGKYASRLISDSRPAGAVTTVLDKSSSVLDPPPSYNSSKHDVQLLTAMVVPYFEQATILDPNFGLLLVDDNEVLPPCDDSGEGGGAGSSKSNKNKWKVPVAVVLSVSGAMALATVGSLYIKKRLMGRRFRDVALSKLSKLSRK